MKEKNETQSKNILTIANFIFAMVVSFFPLIISAIHLLSGTLIHIDVLMLIFVIGWIIFYGLYVFKCGIKININNYIKNPIFYILISIILWIVLSCIFTNSFNMGLIVIAGYFMLGISVYNLKKEHRDIVINSLIIMITICVIMGFFDPYNEFMPGFLTDAYMYSLQFYNPNHSANAIAIIFVLVVGKILSTDVLWKKLLYILSYIILSFHLFLNGSFASLLAIFVGLFIFLIYKWVSEKKMPKDIILLICGFCLISIVIDVIPLLRNIRFTSYGFFVECLAVFDNVFGTKLCKFVSGVDSVPGADGWTRKELWTMSLQYIAECPLFGKGMGFCRNELRPHNILFYLSVDFGVVVGLLFIALNVFIIVHMCRSKNKTIESKFLLISIIVYLIAGLFGNIKTQGFIYFVIVISMLMKENKKARSE